VFSLAEPKKGVQFQPRHLDWSLKWVLLVVVKL
jgi:hypothetical protein